LEIIFDQGLGDIFVVRMAGNILDSNAHGDQRHGRPLVQ
jgi:carbonic anhydrase